MKLWSGRFSKATDPFFERFQASIGFDIRLLPYDIMGSIAHARMLGLVGILTPQETGALIRGLEEILADFEAGNVKPGAEFEDVHMAVESLLTARVGEVGKKIHTGRSRNDQVALDMRLYIRNVIRQVEDCILELMETLVMVARGHISTLMPGYTHLQKAQPVTLAHHLLAYYEMLARDLERLEDCYRRADVMPLGSGALAGTTLPLDRQAVATELCFSRVSANSLDAVADRDFVLELGFDLAMIMTHLSRFSEEIVLWSSDEFGFVELDDAFSTGSSIMPQKKNPDLPELVRGKTGRVYGGLMGLLTVIKGLPLAYNKDLQEDKEAIFDSVDTVIACLRVFPPFLRSLRFDREIMDRGARRGFTNATDVAEYLVRRGVPFREAHAVVGRLVAYCLENKKALEELSLDEFRSYHPAFDQGVLEAVTIEKALEGRNLPGGPAPVVVDAALGEAERSIAIWRTALFRKQDEAGQGAIFK